LGGKISDAACLVKIRIVSYLIKRAKSCAGKYRRFYQQTVWMLLGNDILIDSAATLGVNLGPAPPFDLKALSVSPAFRPLEKIRTNWV